MSLYVMSRRARSVATLRREGGMGETFESDHGSALWRLQ